MEILKEAALMTQLRHPNVVRVNGVVTVGKPHLVVLEFAPLGALQEYLLEHGTELSLEMKEHMAHDVSSGMEYVNLSPHAHTAHTHAHWEGPRTLLVLTDTLVSDCAERSYFVQFQGNTLRR